MSDAYVIQIADQVVFVLNEASKNSVLSRQFVAERTEIILSELSALDDIQVSVVPGHLQASVWDLNRRLAFEWEISVWVQQRIDLIPQDTDPLRLLVEQMVTLFLGQLLSLESTKAKCMRAETVPFPSPASLDVMREFKAGIVFTFRVTQ